MRAGVAAFHRHFTIVAAAGAVLGACASRAPRQVSFAEAGLVSAPRAAASGGQARGAGRLDAATEALLAAIERETGERPVPVPDADAGELRAPAEARAVRRRAQGWTEERSALATELLRAADTGDASVASVRRARAALRWDVLLAARWTEVDRLLVERALAAADEVLPVAFVPTPQAPAFAWPIEPVRITSRFGFRADPFGEGPRRHAGIDLAAVEGQLVRSAAAGTVAFAGLRGGYGLHVEVRHEGELVSRYAHLSDLEVGPGEQIAQGAIVGRAGRTGRATGPHLHFELWRDGLPVDPEDVLPALEKVLSVR